MTALPSLITKRLAYLSWLRSLYVFCFCAPNCTCRFSITWQRGEKSQEKRKKKTNSWFQELRILHSLILFWMSIWKQPNHSNCTTDFIKVNTNNNLINRHIKRVKLSVMHFRIESNYYHYRRFKISLNSHGLSLILSCKLYSGKKQCAGLFRK